MGDDGSNLAGLELRHRVIQTPRGSRVAIPTLIMWGRQDRFLGVDLAEQSAAMCDAARVELIADAGHWMHHEQPRRVNQLLTEHLAQGGAE